MKIWNKNEDGVIKNAFGKEEMDEARPLNWTPLMYIFELLSNGYQKTKEGEDKGGRLRTWADAVSAAQDGSLKTNPAIFTKRKL